MALLIEYSVTLAILICMENSFWVDQHNNSFLSSFQQSWDNYANSKERKNIEQEIFRSAILMDSQVFLQPFTQTVKETFLNIVLQNLLSKLLE